ncbi:MAG TPA: SH3 domain-containing protein, partial [Ruminococcus sp.]|nr:SH3 domain-containing protein [Ruminococcus sp.]
MVVTACVLAGCGGNKVGIDSDQSAAETTTTTITTETTTTTATTVTT